MSLELGHVAEKELKRALTLCIIIGCSMPYELVGRIFILKLMDRALGHCYAALSELEHIEYY